ncbi:S8 family serine peptidase, partial [Candidatus Zixiibacteriota bacterium]
EVELTVKQIKTLAQRDDIERIYNIPKITTDKPITKQSTSMKTTTIESNLTYINAPAAWAAGYTGAGRVVCSFDTGVDGLHPALYDNWKGHDGDSAAAWHDPAKNEPFPHYISDCGFLDCNPAHGTYTTGVMVGHDDITKDTIGVAPGAKWIATAIMDIAGVSIIDGFEWAANPDGDPNTIDDLPDVINHSWGVPGIDCQNIFYDLIDNTEALGIVNIISAGNDGASPSSIRNPADRASDSLDCFAVGNYDHNLSMLVTSSSRGPSLCIQGNFKPNVVAPGGSIRTSSPNSNYSTVGGASLAAPHVSGLVALLRQKNPNATVDEIKTAILTSANNVGQVTPNNNIGWGVIDCLAALNALPATSEQAYIRVFAFDHAIINPGDTVEGSLVLKNTGADLSDVSALLLPGNEALNILDGSTLVGNINEGDTVRSDSQLRVAVSDTTSVGTILSLDMEITGNDYVDTVKLYFLVEPKLFRSFVTHNVGNINFTLTNFGTFGLGDDSFFPAGGVGFTYNSGSNDLFEGGLLIGTNFLKVSDGIRNSVGEPDGDFGVTPGGNIAFVSPKAGISQQTHSSFSDERAELPNGVTIEQNSYAFDYAPYQDFIILQYIIKNISSSILNNIFVGLYMDWDVPFYGSNAGGYEQADDFAWIAYRSNTINIDFRGVKIVDGITQTAFTTLGANVAYEYPGDGFTETEKMEGLTNGFATADSFKVNTNDLVQIVATSISLGIGELDTVAFALLAGETLPEIKTTAALSSSAYDGFITDIKEIDNLPYLPENYTLFQNYPNPFNPVTTISFELPKVSEYTVTIYNLIGQKVEQFSGKADAGLVRIQWDAGNHASGVYLYHLLADEYSASKKMLLLK